jgi:hypothetical protein
LAPLIEVAGGFDPSSPLPSVMLCSCIRALS